eukprot:403348022
MTVVNTFEAFFTFSLGDTQIRMWQIQPVFKSIEQNEQINQSAGQEYDMENPTKWHEKINKIEKLEYQQIFAVQIPNNITTLDEFNKKYSKEKHKKQTIASLAKQEYENQIQAMRDIIFVKDTRDEIILAYRGFESLTVYIVKIKIERESSKGNRINIEDKNFVVKYKEYSQQPSKSKVTPSKIKSSLQTKVTLNENQIQTIVACSDEYLIIVMEKLLRVVVITEKKVQQIAKITFNSLIQNSLQTIENKKYNLQNKQFGIIYKQISRLSQHSFAYLCFITLRIKNLEDSRDMYQIELYYDPINEITLRNKIQKIDI